MKPVIFIQNVIGKWVLAQMNAFLQAVNVYMEASKGEN